MSTSMLHLWSGYDLTLSLYKHVQNDCQIYRPFVLVFFFSLYFWKCCHFGASSLEVHSAVSFLWFGWFFFLLIALVMALPQKTFYLPYWFCPQEHTDTHSRASPFCFYLFTLLTLWCKIKCVHVQIGVFFLSVCLSFLHLHPQCLFSKQLKTKRKRVSTCWRPPFWLLPFCHKAFAVSEVKTKLVCSGSRERDGDLIWSHHFHSVLTFPGWTTCCSPVRNTCR